ncbi:MAG: lipoate--protein ligase family protein [Candidatus Bipolaricaulia bacterium]
MAWRLIRSGPGDPAWNLALDEALWRSFAELGRPTLRLYRWARPAVSIGYAQRAGDYDLKACARLGLTFLRRPTGGRAVLHDHDDRELTFSLVHPVAGLGGVPKSHRLIAEAVALGLKRLGLPAEVEARARWGARPALSGACFEAPTRHELTIAGRKVAGMAQVRDHLALLEHGSLPLELDPDRLAAVICPGDSPREAFIATFRERAAGLLEFKPVELEELEEALCAGFKARFGVELEEAPPTPGELALAEELLERKYKSPEWNLRRRAGLDPSGW